MENGRRKGFLKTELRLRTDVDSIGHRRNKEDSVFHVSICTCMIFMVIVSWLIGFIYLLKCNF